VKRVLGLWDLLVIAAAAIGPAFSLSTTFGAMVGAGAGATPLALVAVTAIMAAVAVGYRRMGERYPNAGSSYSWVRIAFGAHAGAYAAWVLIVGNIFAIVATAVPAGTYTLALVLPGLVQNPFADAIAGALWVLATGFLLNAGLRPTARVTTFLLVAEIAILAISAVVAFAHPPVAQHAAGGPFPGLGGFAGAIAIGIWMIDGWEVSASTAEEAEGSSDAPGDGGLAGLGVSAAIILLCMIAFMRVGTLAGFAENEGDAMAYVAGQLGGSVWRIIVTVTVLISMAAALQATLVYLTRSFFAMGRDGVLPTAFGRLDRRDQPAFGIVVLTALGIVCTLASGFSPSVKTAFAIILGGTSFFLGVLFLMSAAAAVRLFAGEGTRRLSGVALPAFGTLALVGVLAVSLAQSDPSTRLFILVSAAIGVPLALWRGRTWNRAA
jgi:APA family basic amino acid/polyamine antiporter